MKIDDNSRFIIDGSKPFRHVRSMVYTDMDGIERVQFSGSLYAKDGNDMTTAEYIEKVCPGGVVVGWDELLVKIKAYEDSLRTDPVTITGEEHDEALNCLPPCRWHSVNGWSVFHIVERLTGDLVAWYASSKDRGCVRWTDYATITDDQIAAKLPA